MTKVLIADDEKHIVDGLQMLLQEEGYTVDTANDGQKAWDKVQSGEYGLVLADLKMPKMDGLALFAQMRDAGIDSEFIIITGKGTVDSAVEAMRNGAYDYLTKPLEIDRLKALIPKALEKYEVRTANRRLQDRLESLTRYGDMLGQSEEMTQIYKMIEAVAPSSASVLIVGESGTGKELVARAIHNKSPRTKGPFVALNCGAFPREILENELFGHEKGAFTGAINEKPGAFEQADGGTLFLDEVAEMEPDIQVKFLRALEQRSFRRLGGKKEISVDIRVVAATNKNVEEALAEGKLRDDLYHRLAVIPIYLPPLRERTGDVQLLAEEFLRRFADEQGKKITGFSEGALEFIQTYRWPGNVRELKNAVERAVILAKTDVIEVRDLSPKRFGLEEREVHIPVGTSIADTEKAITLKTFAFTGGDQKKTAKILGVSEKDLKAKLQTYLGANATKPRSTASK
ncbi:MAG: sigma-54-dependent Fis family transcriptional regulator [Candidatus Cloacimonetes bacterium]|jgi:DNA-binding NtrC family response regulator|nr:sigma-54-dependent Fis family transcriptional regulator [Candidatus Cloacimonadota bacterium]